MSDKSWCVYLLFCADQSIYTGITVDIDSRIEKHNAGTASKYTRSRRPVRLAYLEHQESKSVALKREHQIKRLSRPQKLALIASDASHG